MIKMTKAKRPDIQGIRGLAIASVLGFHLKGDQFPVGFVGVDIFFVLSGFLMSSILSREKTINLQVLCDFYTRRFKRIVPLYALLLLALFILVPLLLLARDTTKFVSDSIWAALFATNIHSLLEKSDYFAELFDSNLLTHTWSLGVEIQYYLIVPFLMSLKRFLGTKLGLPYLTVIIAASFTFQCWASANVSFNALPSRVWQFLTGGIAHDLILLLCSSPAKIQAEQVINKEELEMEIEKASSRRKNNLRYVILLSLSVLLSIILFLLALSPVRLLNNPALRGSTVVLTAALIVLGEVEDQQSVLLSNRPIVYLGDISYVVYLVHWPVVVMWKSYWDLLVMPVKDIHLCLAITFLISILVHHTLEKWFISSSTTASTIIVGLIYSFICCAVIFNLPLKLNQVAEYELPTDQRLLDAINWNEDQSHFQYYSRQRPFEECLHDPEGIRMRDAFVNTQPLYECLWTPKNSTGNVSVLVVGNSIAHRATQLLHSILKHNPDVKEMRLFAHAACRPLKNCARFFGAMMKLVERMKPDITLLIYDDSDHLLAPIEDITTDKPLADFVKFLRPLSENSKFLVLDEFYPKTGTLAGVAPSMYKRLLRNRSLDDLRERYQTFSDAYSSYFKRLDQFPAHYPNLIRHNTSGPICADDPGWCWWYNRKNLHAYYTDHSHFTADGLEMLRKSYKEILDNLIQRSKNEHQQ
ncbi:hypothetical protein PRIPAC_95845 [Pristionchus pacificus]|uniref:Acyltransferase n=1 Tax=Pristionchus pacificus TaxID=54126 RepID=A0A2A6BIX4_PRIPA|nr:hypothetical protein PRIPAC_95845 [Pristionchus pacificus]|eukprot:PDM65778.1 Acyltransferase [Pristionchus pacificus]